MVININKLRACINIDSGKQIVELENTPHFEYLNGYRRGFVEYTKKYAPLRKGTEYFDELYYCFDARRTGEIQCYKSNDFYVIADGLHRAVIMKHRGFKTVNICLS